MSEEACKGLAGVIIARGGGVMAVRSKSLFIGDAAVMRSMRAGDGFIDIKDATPELVWKMAEMMENDQ